MTDLLPCPYHDVPLDEDNQPYISVGIVTNQVRCSYCGAQGHCDDEKGEQWNSVASHFKEMVILTEKAVYKTQLPSSAKEIASLKAKLEDAVSTLSYLANLLEGSDNETVATNCLKRLCVE